MSCLLALSGVIVAAFVFVLFTIGLDFLRPPVATTPLSAVTATSTPSPSPTSSPAPARPVELGLPPPTPTPAPGGQTLSLVPHTGDAGWWVSDDTLANHLGDSFLYAGRLGEQQFLSMVRFDLARVVWCRD